MLKILRLVILVILVVTCQVSAGRKAALLAAVRGGHTKTVAALLLFRADPNAISRDNQTALMLAISNNRIEIMRLLLDAQADPNIQNEYGNTALVYVSLSRLDKERSIEIAQELLGRRADPTSKNDDKITVLMRAAFYGNANAELVQILLDAQADPEAKDCNGRSALKCAISQDHREIVQTLLKARININATDNEGQTPLMDAVLSGHAPMVRVLLDAGADPNLICYRGESALTLAIKMNYHQIVEELLKVANPVMRDYIGNMPNLFFIMHNDTGMKRVLMDYRNLYKGSIQELTKDDEKKIIKKIIENDFASLLKMQLSPRIVTIIYTDPELQSLILPDSFIARLLKDYKEKYLTLRALRNLDDANPLSNVPIELINEILSYIYY